MHCSRDWWDDIGSDAVYKAVEICGLEEVAHIRTIEENAAKRFTASPLALTSG